MCYEMCDYYDELDQVRIECVGSVLRNSRLNEADLAWFRELLSVQGPDLQISAITYRRTAHCDKPNVKSMFKFRVTKCAITIRGIPVRKPPHTTQNKVKPRGGVPGSKCWS